MESNQDLDTLKPDKHSYPSHPFLNRRTSHRVMLAVVISVVAHLGIFLFYNAEPTPEQPDKPRVFLAELQTEVAQRNDVEDRRGDIADEPPATVQTPAEQLPSESAPTEPEALPAAELPPPDVVTTTSSPEKTPRPAEQTTAQQQTAAQQQAEEPARKTPVPEQKPAPQKQVKPETTAPAPSESPFEAPATESSKPAPPSSLQTQGDEPEFSDPLEHAYYELLVAHLNARLPAHPKGVAGKVRLEIKIQFGSVITGVKIINSSGNAATDEWARKAALSVSPVPPVPDKFEQPYYFRPTLLLTP